MTTTPWDVRVSPVLEVNLDGEADPAWWNARLAPHHLHVAGDGARVRVSATAARFMGIAFREGIIGVAVRGPHGDGLWMEGAVNVLSFFAWVERARNKSPYVHGAVALTPEEASFSLSAPGLGLSGRSARPTNAPPGAAVFDGPIYLPPYGGIDGLYFLARLEGPVHAWPFDPVRDTWSLEGDGTVATALRASGFTPTRWSVSAGAVHAKTKTLR